MFKQLESCWVTIILGIILAACADFSVPPEPNPTPSETVRPSPIAQTASPTPPIETPVPSPTIKCFPVPEESETQCSLYPPAPFPTPPASPTPEPIVETIAGSGDECCFPGSENVLIGGFKDGKALEARFDFPTDIALHGNDLYIADRDNHRIRKLNLETQMVETVAGNGAPGFKDGNALEAQFNEPRGLFIDKNANIYVADSRNRSIRKITSDNQVKTVINTDLFVTGIISQDSETLFIGSNNKILSFNLNASLLTIITGKNKSTLEFGGFDGRLEDAFFRSIAGITIDKDGNLYVSDSTYHRIRKILLKDRFVMTLAGNGKATFKDGVGKNASLYTPTGIDIDKQNHLYVAEAGSHLIRKVTPEAIITTIAGIKDGGSGLVDGSASKARFNDPLGIAVAPDGSLYIADSGNNRIRKITFQKPDSRM